MKQSILDHMVEYMKFDSADDENDPAYDPDFDAGYTQAHIDQCEQHLDAFLVDLSQVSEPGKQAKILLAVKTVVLNLNELNEACDSPLIETLEREYLCEFIITAAKQAGLEINDDDDDITYEWREW